MPSALAGYLAAPVAGLVVCAAVILTLVLAVVRNLGTVAAPGDGGARSDVRAIRAGSAIALLATVLLIGDCSATGLRTARGDGYQLMAADPLVYVTTLLLLIGPLVASLAAPALLTLGSLSARRVRLIMLAAWLCAPIAAMTAYAGFLTSYVAFCAAVPPSAAGDASCAASTGAVAGISGVLGLVTTLPFALSRIPPTTRDSGWDVRSRGGIRLSLRRRRLVRLPPA